VRVQACDLNFKPLDGFTFDDCVCLQGDELHAPVRWKNKTPQDLIGQPVRLEFELFEAQLYAVRWTTSARYGSEEYGHDYGKQSKGSTTGTSAGTVFLR